MRGCPKSIETKQDYINSISLYPEETKTALRQLIADRFVFVRGAILQDGDEGITDASHCVITESETNAETGESTTVRYQAEKAEDPNARLFRIGFTVDEAQKLIA